MNACSHPHVSPSTFLIITHDELAVLLQSHEERVVSRLCSVMRDIQPQPQQKYLSRREAAEKLGVTLQTLSRYCREEGLIPCKVGNRVRFRQSDFDSWLAEKRTKSTVSAQ